VFHATSLVPPPRLSEKPLWPAVSKRAFKAAGEAIARG